MSVVTLADISKAVELYRKTRLHHRSRSFHNDGSVIFCMDDGGGAAVCTVDSYDLEEVIVELLNVVANHAEKENGNG